MKASEAREAAIKVGPTERQLPIESYMKWVHGRIKSRVSDGEFKVTPVFDKMTVLPPNKETCNEVAELLKVEGYEVAFDEKGILTRVSW